MFLDLNDPCGYTGPSIKDGKEPIVAFITNNPLTFEQVSAVIAYDPITGVFTWKIAPNRRKKIGALAGTWKRVRKTNGKVANHLYLTYDGYSTPAARFAWLLQTGKWPDGNIQYDDGDSENLKFSNLREALFTKTVTRPDGLKQRKETRDVWYGRSLMRFYGMTVAEYGEMMVKQGGVCAICSKPEDRKANGEVRALSVDHCHDSGDVRGLLCSFCNSVLGQAKDSIPVLEAAILYLKAHADKKIKETA